jgi:hypothetical protein
MHITFFDIKGTVRFEFIPQQLTVNRAYYMETLKRIREAVHGKMPELWPIVWILHLDNAPAHKMLIVKQSVAQKSFNEMKHHPPIPPVWLRMASVSKNEICLRKTNISAY